MKLRLKTTEGMTKATISEHNIFIWNNLLLLGFHCELAVLEQQLVLELP